MSQKHIPFGYEIENGKAVINLENAAIVKQVFEKYISGISTNRIAKELSEKRVLRPNHKSLWYHGDIGIMLENKRYLGDGYLPSLIDENLFECVQKKRMKMRQHLGRNISQNNHANYYNFSGKLWCGKCGQQYQRYTDSDLQSEEKSRWKCKHYIRKKRVYCRNQFLRDGQIIENFLEAINRIIDSPQLLDFNQEKKCDETTDKRITNQICLMLKSRNVPAQEFKMLVFERARQAYQKSEINDFEYQTTKIKRILADLKKQSEFNETLFEQLIRRVVIFEDGKIIYQFLNGIEINTYIKK